MNKLITYLKQGKGHGLKAVLIFSVLVSLCLWGITYATAQKISDSPLLNTFIDQLPTIVIQDGVVVKPTNTDTIYPLKGRPFFHLQTDREEVSPLSEDGIYLTRKMFAIVADQQIQQGAFLSGSTTITAQVIRDIIHTSVIWIPVLLALSYFATFWIFYFVVLGISALITWIGRLSLNKGAIWRSTSFAVIAIISIDILTNFLLIFFGKMLRLGMPFQLTSCVLLVLLISFGIREQKTPQKKSLK